MKDENIYRAIGEIDDALILEADTRKKSKPFIWPIAAAITLSILIPNFNGDLAMALGDIPLLGKYFEVVTLKTYTTAHLHVDMPVIKDDSPVIVELNRTIEDYLNTVMAAVNKNTDSPVQLTDMTYEVISDTENWFTLAIYKVEIAASGFDSAKYYNIDKQTNTIVDFSDLVTSFDTANEVLSAYIREKASAEMKARFTLSLKVISLSLTKTSTLTINTW